MSTTTSDSSDAPPRQRERKQLIVRIDPDLHTTLSAFAAMDGMSLSSFVIRAIENDLRDHRADYGQRLLDTMRGYAAVAPTVSSAVGAESAAPVSDSPHSLE